MNRGNATSLHQIDPLANNAYEENLLGSVEGVHSTNHVGTGSDLFYNYVPGADFDGGFFYNGLGAT
jgi:hypothetical protein